VRSGSGKTASRKFHNQVCFHAPQAVLLPSHSVIPTSYTIFPSLPTQPD
jgi:hypothetical protein